MKRKATIKETGEAINYYTNAGIPYRNDKHRINFDIARKISDFLHVKCPYIGYPGEIQTKDGGSLFAITYNPDELVNTNNYVVLMNQETINSSTLAIGILAHEIRHIWQIEHCHKKLVNARDQNALYDPDEIDADGFAICYAACGNPDKFHDVARIICPDEFTYFPDAFKKRLKRAYEIKKEINGGKSK